MLEDYGSSRSLTTYGMETDLIFLSDLPDEKYLQKMQSRAVLDVIAQQILARKGEVAKVLGAEAKHQSLIIFLDELVRSEELARRAEQLTMPLTRRAFEKYLAVSLQEFGRFLERADMQGDQGLLRIAGHDPFPPEEEQRGFLRRLFGG